ncbi:MULTISPECIES: DMT family transporter [unclassified Sphaerochaeta]|jgi:transporter family-2 protein|uniref:DMT family transporter n=1 Tax=unclassified Sphaerochaeta TaxID=2637943 RepID=UPI0025FAFB03|nr:MULTISPECIES: DMT family transporter [unclassified Sphaerochaeta]MDX9824527.1 DMT family transporter [Sphaerochaeta sp.]
MNPALYLFLDILTGMVISVMVVANTLYGQATTMGVSLIVNHTIGLTILSLILLVGRNKPAIRGPGLKAPWYLYFNGLFGLAILNLNYYTVINAGASLAMASTVFGQSICSLVFDLTGWMGMQKRSLNKTKAVSLLVSLAGILAMATSGDGTFALLSILLGILAGSLTMIQMVLNSTLAIYKGPIRASHQNFIGGLAAGLVFYFLLQGEQTLAGLAATPGLPFLLVFSGGTLAVFVVVSTSYVIVKIPAVYSALLLSSAQILMSLAIDTIFFDSFSLPLLLGSLLMLLGMGGNLAADKKANP